MPVQGLDRLMRRMSRLKRDGQQFERPLRASGVYLLSSIEKNFRAQGRPKKWEKLADSTLARRRKGRGKGKAQILIDKGLLKNSPSMKMLGNGIAVGTNKVQARRQHFGFPKGTGRGKAKTPARPFLMIQDEDVEVIGNIFKRHIS